MTLFLNSFLKKEKKIYQRCSPQYHQNYQHPFLSFSPSLLLDERNHSQYHKRISVGAVEAPPISSQGPHTTNYFSTLILQTSSPWSLSIILKTCLNKSLSWTSLSIMALCLSFQSQTNSLKKKLLNIG